LTTDKRKLADAFPDFVVAYNDTLAREGLTLSEWQTFAKDDKASKASADYEADEGALSEAQLDQIKQSAQSLINHDR